MYLLLLCLLILILSYIIYIYIHMYISLSLSTYLYYLSYLSFYLYGRYLSCFLYRLPLFSIYTGVIPLAFCLFVCRLSVLRTIWIVSLLFYICAIFLPIRTGAIPPVYFPRGLSTPFVLLLSNLHSNTCSKRTP
jgi:hypothetical protein